MTPSNLGVFQAACVAVLTGAYGIHAAQALGYGIILQAVEIATAVVMGAPALRQGGRVLARGAPARAAHRARLARPGVAAGSRGLSPGLTAALIERQFALSAGHALQRLVCMLP